MSSPSFRSRCFWKTLASTEFRAPDRSQIGMMIVSTHRPKSADQNIVIAWSPSSQATRAVHDAMPILTSSAKGDCLRVWPTFRRHDDAPKLLGTSPLHAVVSETDQCAILECFQQSRPFLLLLRWRTRLCLSLVLIAILDFARPCSAVLQRICCTNYLCPFWCRTRCEA